MRSGKYPKTFTLSYCSEYLSHGIFCEYVLGVSHIPYAEDFAHFWQKDEFKIKMKFKKQKST